LKSGGLKFKAYEVEANGYNRLEGDSPAPKNEVRFEIILGALLEEQSGAVAPVDYDPRYCQSSVVIQEPSGDMDENQIDLLFVNDHGAGCW
jgi:hypothetical protein